MNSRARSAIGILTLAGPLYGLASDPAAFVQFYAEAGPTDAALAPVPGPAGTTLRFAATPTLDLHSVAHAWSRPSRVGSGYAVWVEFTPAGQRRFQSMTAGLIGRHLGVMVEGHFPGTPLVQTAIIAHQSP